MTHSLEPLERRRCDGLSGARARRRSLSSVEELWRYVAEWQQRRSGRLECRAWPGTAALPRWPHSPGKDPRVIFCLPPPTSATAADAGRAGTACHRRHRCGISRGRPQACRAFLRRRARRSIGACCRCGAWEDRRRGCDPVVVRSAVAGQCRRAAAGCRENPGNRSSEIPTHMTRFAPRTGVCRCARSPLPHSPRGLAHGKQHRVAHGAPCTW